VSFEKLVLGKENGAIDEIQIPSLIHLYSLL
jgi:hypothetical protein